MHEYASLRRWFSNPTWWQRSRTWLGLHHDGCFVGKFRHRSFLDVTHSCMHTLNKVCTACIYMCVCLRLTLQGMLCPWVSCFLTCGFLAVVWFSVVLGNVFIFKETVCSCMISISIRINMIRTNIYAHIWIHVSRSCMHALVKNMHAMHACMHTCIVVKRSEVEAICYPLSKVGHHLPIGQGTCTSWSTNSIWLCRSNLSMWTFLLCGITNTLFFLGQHCRFLLGWLQFLKEAMVNQSWQVQSWRMTKYGEILSMVFGTNLRKQGVMATRSFKTTWMI